MVVRHFTQRTVYVATCIPCQWKDTRTENPPREVQCPTCKTWYAFNEISWTGPDTFDKR